jgi:hypothetical protein
VDAVASIDIRKPPSLNDANALEHFEQAAARMLPWREASGGSGRGVVVCGGGVKYLTCAWVCIHMLRYMRCRLPVELWHFGSREMPAEIASLFEALGVTCVDAEVVRQKHPVRILNGWELKPFALLHSRFREILLLDADNVVVADPTFLFDSPEFEQTGSIFWPDYSRLEPQRRIWSLTGVEYRDEPEFETGQLVIDKQRCWAALNLAMWMNEFSDFWYGHIHGDKETFHLAWRKLGQPYAMPERGIDSLDGTMCQHDFAGRRLFQHRNMAKWTLGDNAVVSGFFYEAECLHVLELIRGPLEALSGPKNSDPRLAVFFAGRTADYHRIGHDRRQISFDADGRIGVGSDRMERSWSARMRGKLAVLEIFGDDGLTASCSATPGQDDVWKGEWHIHERMPIVISIQKQGAGQ